MEAKAELPKQLQALVEDVGRPVSSDDIDLYRQLQRIESETYRLRTVRDQRCHDFMEIRNGEGRVGRSTE